MDKFAEIDRLEQYADPLLCKGDIDKSIPNYVRIPLKRVRKMLFTINRHQSNS